MKPMQSMHMDVVRRWLPGLLVVILALAIGIAQPQFLSPSNLLELIGDTAVLFVMATGLTFVIMLGGIDLSVQAMASLASVIVALTLSRLGYAAFGLALVVGAVAGLLSGVAHVWLKIPSFIATLALGGVLTGAALVISNERSIPLSSDVRPMVTWISGHTFAVPNVIFIGAVVLVGAHIVQSRTRFGRYVEAIGAGEPAAYASGVLVGRQKIIAFVISGLFAALAGMMLGARLTSGSPVLADEFLLPSIAAVVVGGNAITGGVGSIWRTLIGALMISLVRVGMTFLGVDIFAQSIVFGLALIAAVAVTIDRSKIPIVK